MESPERNESTIAAPVDPGSPFFKYLCGLSPIKPQRSVHVVQTYAELSLPPPPTVFTSPPNPHRGGGRSKRSIVVSRSASTHVTVEVVGPWGNGWAGGAGAGGGGNGGGGGSGSGERRNEANQSYTTRKSYSAAQVDADSKSLHSSSEHNSRQHFWRLQVEQQEQAAASNAEPPSNFEYGDVSDYLADPAEGGLYVAGTCSSQLTSKAEVPKSSRTPEEGYGYYHQNGEGRSLPPEHPDRAGCSADAANVEAPTRPNAIQRASSGSSGDQDGSGGGEKSLTLDEETARMAYLLVDEAEDEGEGKNAHEWGASQLDLAEFSRHHNPDFAPIERIGNFAHLKTREDFELAAAKALENQRNALAGIRDREAAGDRTDAVVGTPTITGQRGVRRRCLDFEASARRKSMGNGSSRKRTGSRSEALPTNVSALPSTSRLPTATMCERAIAKSDATNSVAAATSSVAPNARSDGGSGIPECAPSAHKVLSPGLVRISRSIMQRSADLMASEQYLTDPSRGGGGGSGGGREGGNSIGIPSGIGLHLNSLTGRISFSPTNKAVVKQEMNIASIPKGAVATLLGMPNLVGAKTENRAEDYGNSALSDSGPGPSNNFSMGLATTSTAAAGVVMVMERSRMSMVESLPVVDTAQTGPPANPMQALPDRGGNGGQALEAARPSTANGLEKLSSSAEKKRALLRQEVSLQANTEEYESPRSQQKRRKSSGSGDKSGEGCKRCTCKKSKCLKLYCECFAAGTYCVGSCTCRDCFNKPEHEETVMTTRRQIESRNPLAFAPKIVHSADGSSPKQPGEETVETPASAHHKRGCNCKKSLCLKKYCECYQAGVGCSDGCRCEGCKNMYGRKEPIEESDEMEAAAEALDSGSMEDELDLPRPGYHTNAMALDPQQRASRKELSPITPSFQYTGQGRAVERVRSAGKKRSSSPLLALQAVAKPPRSPAFATRSSTKFLANGSAQQTPELQHFKGVNSPNSTPKLSRVNQLSPRWDGLGDICTLTPLPQPPLRPTPASMSTLDRTGASPSFSYQSIEPISSYQPDKLDSLSKSSPPSFQQASDHSPLSSCGLLTLQKENSLSTHCSAALPTASYLGSGSGSGNGNGSGKVEDARAADLSFMCDDDDTPDFLKYEDSINSPVVTKSGSPNQKRVSPPHFAGMRERNGDGRVVFESPARSSSGLRRGRKFILQALP